VIVTVNPGACDFLDFSGSWPQKEGAAKRKISMRMNSNGPPPFPVAKIRLLWFSSF
jgi:hypothetical protein